MKLAFGIPSWQEGPNVTVRLGSKWYTWYFNNRFIDQSGVIVDKGPVPVVITNTNGTQLAEAVIENVLMFSFCDIPETILRLEHDLACHTLSGLYAAMKVAYGDKFDMSSRVSVVFFSTKESSL